MDRETFAQQAIDRFQDQDSFMYTGDLECPPWGLLGFVGTNRDADVLSRCNFEVISGSLLENYPEDFEVEEYGHWLVGWVRGIRVNTESPEALDFALEWAEAMEQYPVADEEKFIEMEHEEDQEYYRQGGREELIEMLFSSEHFSGMFDDETGEFMGEFYEETLNDAFHRAMSEGDHTALPPDHITLAVAREAYEDQKYWDRVKFEQYNPPLF